MTLIVTPVSYQTLGKLLKQYQYNQKKAQKLIDGFKQGFSIGYEGSKTIKQTAPNLKLRIGSKVELWNKVMKEVKEHRYAGPFKQIPFESYIQSPIGLVPKDGGRKTRLIFHLSYPRNGNTSVNHNTPKSKTTVKYPSFLDAVKLCMDLGECCVAKSDLTSAFRQLAVMFSDWRWLVMKAQSPLDDVTYYFIDKCLPFGAAISCKHFQDFSDALAFLMFKITGHKNVNYLDDFLFAALLRSLVNNQVQDFLDLCKSINLPVSLDKTFWGSTRIVFLGLMIDTVNRIISIPVEKVLRAKESIAYFLARKSKNITVLELQKVCGFLNFIGQCILPARAFTRRLYAYTAGKRCKHFHIDITRELRMDLNTWLTFLNSPSIYNRPFIDITGIETANSNTVVYRRKC